MTWAISNRIFFSAIFLSGFSALIYQLIWIRLLGLVFGVSSFAVATVVAVFLLGLGLGSLYFGRWSERFKNPLKVYLWVELSIALLCLLSYLIIQHLPLYGWLYEYSYNHLDFFGLTLVRLLLSVVVLLPPVFAIGGTIPLLSKYFLTSPTTIGSRFSRIYYMNTLGAFAGSLLTGFVFVKYLGVVETLMLAVVLNLVIVAMIAFNRSEAERLPETTQKKAPYSYMLIILFITGFISLSYEILWVRILSTYSLATSQAFALIVAGFLLGFAIGSFFISRVIDASKNLALLFSRVCVLTAVSGALVLFIFQRFELIRTTMAELLPLNLFTISLALAFIVSLIPAVFMGILFPLGLRIYVQNADNIGIKTGRIFFANTIGCVSGSLLTGFLFIPFVGMWNTTLILVNLSLAIAIYLLAKHRTWTMQQVVVLLVVFLASNALVFSDQTTFHKQIRGFDVIYYAEGLSGTVTAIERQNYRGLFVDGENVSGTDRVLLADSKMLAHLPLLIAENPESALTVGYGTGVTSHSMLLHDVAVDAVEIEEKIIEAGPLFGSVNGHSYDNPNLDIVLDDARNYIDVVNEKFDAIVTDVTNLKYKRNPYLYTQEYFEIMQNALDEDGVAAAWLPMGGLSFNDLKVLIGTFDRVYPHTTVWYFTQYPTHFIILVGTPDKTEIDLQQMAVENLGVRQDLKSISVDNKYEIASMLLLGEEDVDQLVAGSAIHTDNHPILEFSDMGMYMQTDLESNLAGLLKYQRENLATYFSAPPEEIEMLEGHFEKYNKIYHNFVNRPRPLLGQQ